MKCKHLLIALFLLSLYFPVSAQDTVTTTVRELSGHTEDIEALLYSPDGRYLVSGGWDNTIKVWTADSNLIIKDFKAHDAAVRCLAYSRDGKLLISGARDNSVKIWDSTWNIKYSLFGHQNTINTVVLDPKKRFAYSGSADGTIKSWDLAKKGESRNFAKMAGAVNAICMNLTGADIYVATKGPDIYKLNVQGQEKGTFKGHTDEINSLAFALNNKNMVSGSSDKTAIIWDVVTGKPLHVLKGHKWKVTSVAYSYDSKFVVTGSTDGTIKLWDAETGNELYNFEGKGTSVAAVAMSPDITRIASVARGINEGPDDKKYLIYIWDSRQELQKVKDARYKKFREDSIGRLRDSVKRLQDSVKAARDSLKKVQEQQKLDKKNKPAPAPPAGGKPGGTSNKEIAPPRKD